MSVQFLLSHDVLLSEKQNQRTSCRTSVTSPSHARTFEPLKCRTVQAVKFWNGSFHTLLFIALRLGIWVIYASWLGFSYYLSALFVFCKFSLHYFAYFVCKLIQPMAAVHLHKNWLTKKIGCRKGVSLLLLLLLQRCYTVVLRCLLMISSSTAAPQLETFLLSTWSRTRSSWSGRRRTDSARASRTWSLCLPASSLSEQATEPSASWAAWERASSEPS